MDKKTKNAEAAAESTKEAELLNKVGPNEPIANDQPSEEFKAVLKAKPTEAEAPKDRHYIKRFKAWVKSLSKKQKIGLGVAVVLALAGIVALVLVLTKSDPPAPVQPQQQVVETPKSSTVRSKLTGVQVDPAMNKRPITAVMIENSPDARPQSGLTSAGIVYEAIAEGGITRFMALYQEDQPQYIGPVRSARPYFIYWAEGYDASLAHAGGSADGLAIIRRDGVRDLDFAFNSQAYHRINSRYSPHNLYTSLDGLGKINKTRKYKPADFKEFARKDDQPAKTVTAGTINLGISGFYYNPTFKYDKTSNKYKRSQAGKPHTDEKSGKTIAPKVVVALVIPHRVYNGVNTDYHSLGSGKAYIFQDGLVKVGKWIKKSKGASLRLLDSKGKDIPLNAGQTWISAVGLDSGVTYKP